MSWGWEGLRTCRTRCIKTASRNCPDAFSKFGCACVHEIYGGPGTLGCRYQCFNWQRSLAHGNCRVCMMTRLLCPCSCRRGIGQIVCCAADLIRHVLYGWETYIASNSVKQGECSENFQHNLPTLDYQRAIPRPLSKVVPFQSSQIPQRY